jgi:hypothetical protein
MTEKTDAIKIKGNHQVNTDSQDVFNKDTGATEIIEPQDIKPAASNNHTD